MISECAFCGKHCVQNSYQIPLHEMLVFTDYTFALLPLWKASWFSFLIVIDFIRFRLINLVAEDNAIEDTTYHLHRALNARRIDLERFIRVRHCGIPWNHDTALLNHRV